MKQQLHHFKLFIMEKCALKSLVSMKHCMVIITNQNLKKERQMVNYNSLFPLENNPTGHETPVPPSPQ